METLTLTDESGQLLLSDCSSPTVEPILQIHRGHDSYVTFHVKENGKMVRDCSVNVGELETMFPQFRAELERDAYFSLNSFYRRGHGRGLAGLHRAFRRSDAARYLNCCFVDVDCHDGLFDFGTTFGRVVTMQDAGTIPAATMIVRSGRGLWLMWLLVDEMGSNIPPTAHASRRLLWEALQEELGRRLEPLGADMGALDVARITRVPGSLNSHSATRVMYYLQANAAGQPFVYTMENLADIVSVPIPQMRPRRSGASAPSFRAKNGWVALYEHRLNDFLRLKELRGGFREGHRHNAVYVFASTLRGRGFNEDTILRAAEGLGRDCQPPLPTSDIKDAVGQSRRCRYLKDSTIARKLAVTPEERLQIRPWSESVYQSPDTVSITPEARRALEVELITKHGPIATRAMSQALRHRGVVANYSTVARDYKRLISSGMIPLITNATQIESFTHNLSLYVLHEKEISARA